MTAEQTRPDPILAATDFSDRSQRALRRAARLAKQLASRLVLVHIVDDDQPLRLVETLRGEADALLEETRRSLCQEEEITCTYRLGSGDAATGILEIAEGIDAELVVIGAHRRSLFDKIVLGTTAERMIRTTDRPVLMAAGAPEDAYDRILAPIDPGAGSGHALAALDRLGLAETAAVTAVYVFATPELAHLRRASLSQEALEAYRAHRRAECEDALRAFLLRTDFRDRAHLRVQENRKGIAVEIAEAAEDSRANLLVLATHQRTGLDKLFLGSVTERLLSRAQWDILVVPNRPAG